MGNRRLDETVVEEQDLMTDEFELDLELGIASEMEPVDQPTLRIDQAVVSRLRAAAAQSVHYEPVAMAHVPDEDLDAPTLQLPPLHAERLRRASEG